MNKMNENINKPITIVRAEFISNLVNLINKSTLPPFVMEPILKEVYSEVKTLAQKQYEMDVAKYEQAKQELLKSDSSESEES